MENPTDNDLFDYRYAENERDILTITSKSLTNEYCILETTFSPLFIPANAYEIFHGRVYHQSYDCNAGDKIELIFTYRVNEINLTEQDSLIIEIVE